MYIGMTNRVQLLFFYPTLVFDLDNSTVVIGLWFRQYLTWSKNDGQNKNKNIAMNNEELVYIAIRND